MVVLSTDLPARHTVRPWSDGDWTNRSPVAAPEQQTTLQRRDGRDHASQPTKERVARDALRRRTRPEGIE